MKLNKTNFSLGGGSCAPYEAPRVEVAEIRVEHGFAASINGGSDFGNGWNDNDLPDYF